jgi:hypothetical protein
MINSIDRNTLSSCRYAQSKARAISNYLITSKGYINNFDSYGAQSTPSETPASAAKGEEDRTDSFYYK